MDMTAPLHVDGFLSMAEMAALAAQGAVGEITSWVYDREGHLIDCDYNLRVASAPLPKAADRAVIAVAVGESKVKAIRAALEGHLINGVITSEATAERLLSDA
jgi:DNA-binding transcriptional regulator LsrR (DeoR family)